MIEAVIGLSFTCIFIYLVFLGIHICVLLSKYKEEERNKPITRLDKLFPAKQIARWLTEEVE